MKSDKITKEKKIKKFNINLKSIYKTITTNIQNKRNRKLKYSKYKANKKNIFITNSIIKYSLYKAKFNNVKNYLIEVNNKFVSTIKKHKRNLAIGTSVLVLLISSILIYASGIGYKVAFNGQDVGVVKNQELFTQALDRVNSELSNWYNNTNIVFDQELTFERVRIEDKKVLKTINECTNALYSTDIDVAIDGAVIVIDEEEVVTLSSAEEAEEVMEGVLQPYTKESEKEKLLGEPVIEQKYDIVEKLVSFEDIKEVETAKRFIQQGTDEIHEYTVKSGDTTWDIAVSRGVSINQIEDANPDKDITRLHNGDVLKLTVAKPYLTVKTKKEIKYDNQINYGTTYKNDSTVYVGTNKVISAGIYGVKEITAIVTYENGVETSRNVINEKVIKEPVNEVVAKGTKPLPPVRGSGSFIMPASGRVSAINKPGSHAGSRAVDIANSAGTTIYASDTGVVKKASWYNAYGKCIIVDHGNGYSTLYGHLSSINVSVGQKVSKGQSIGRMGSTGRSTGNHLHFEIRYNNSRQVITKYFKFLKVGRRVAALQ